MANPMSFFSENVDQWGAAEWFNRLAKAIREQDKAVVTDNDIAVATYRMIAASSAMTLVRDHEADVRAALDAKPDPALIGITEEMKESGGHWMPCTGCYDTEDGYPTQKYAYSPALQTDIGCGCHECGGLGAVWWHMTDEELAQFEKECAGTDATEPSGTSPIRQRGESE